MWGTGLHLYEQAFEICGKLYLKSPNRCITGPLKRLRSTWCSPMQFDLPRRSPNSLVRCKAKFLPRRRNNLEASNPISLFLTNHMNRIQENLKTHPTTTCLFTQSPMWCKMTIILLRSCETGGLICIFTYSRIFVSCLSYQFLHAMHWGWAEHLQWVPVSVPSFPAVMDSQHLGKA
jgi:hypothetical protein